jgi:hypothetical protein
MLQKLKQKTIGYSAYVQPTPRGWPKRYLKKAETFIVKSKSSPIKQYLASFLTERPKAIKRP